MADWLDLTQPFFVGMPQGAVADRLTLTHRTGVALASTDLPLGCSVTLTELSMAVHCGTHVDAPRHFIEGAPSITDYPVGRFVSGAVMVSVVAKALQVITVADLESAGAQPRAGDMLFIRTGWGSLFNADNEAEYYGHHPYLSPEVADWVLEKGVRAIGTDTLNPEPPLAARPPRYAWPIHCQLLANDVLIFENLNLEPLAGKRSCRLSVVAAPIAITESDGAPARVIAQLADE